MQRLWFSEARLPNGWTPSVRVTVDDGLIARVERNVAPESEDARHGIALPGLPNVHSHGFQRGMAGLSERRGRPDDDFWSWREVMYRFLDRLTPDDIAAITAQAYVEMLETGYTRVGEFHYLHNNVDGSRYTDPAETAARIIEAAEISGIGLTLLPVFYAHSDFGGLPPTPGQRRFVSSIDGFAELVAASRAKLRPGDNLGIAPHSLRAVTPDELKAILPLGENSPIHIHAAEQRKEVEACIAWSGARPVQWLLDNVTVDQRWCLIHATHLEDAECDALASSGAVVGLCPVTEANLGDGIFPAERYIAAGGRFGTGTDSNILVDAADELRLIEYAQRLTRRRRNILSGETTPSTGAALFDAALTGGAQALGVRSGIVEGASADLVTLNTNHPSLIGRQGDLLLDGWIFASRSGVVDGVWQAGRQLVLNGRHVHGEAVAARYRAALARILA
jgi:formiminoglutamate deiminase